MAKIIFAYDWQMPLGHFSSRCAQFPLASYRRKPVSSAARRRGTRLIRAADAARWMPCQARHDANGKTVSTFSRNTLAFLSPRGRRRQGGRHRRILWRVLLILLCVVAPLSAHAQNNDFATWLQDLEQEAISDGITLETVHAALDPVTLDKHVLDLDQTQPETIVSFDTYVSRTVTPERVERGREEMQQYAVLLNTISQRYGVLPQIIVALWGIESSFGRTTGHYEIVDSLATLAYQGRRADFFRAQLMDALRILDRAHMPASALRGSWAGAMGQCQFMPSTYLKYAVAYTNGVRSDIWDSEPDVFASIANYLAAEGWDSDLTWGQEVELENQPAPAVVGLTHHRSLEEWSRMGVRNSDGSALPDSDLQASLIQPDGPDGRSFIVYDSFRALMRWNRSDYFATAVGLLANRIVR
jgi:membrane-bound lytic murein transglycosylase B